MKFPGQSFQKLEHEQDRQTNRCDRTHSTAKVVKIRRIFLTSLNGLMC